MRVENDEIYQDRNGKIEFLKNVIEKLSQLKVELIFIVTNQNGIDLGRLSEKNISDWINQIEKAAGIHVGDYWASPYKISFYRKPNPGMILGLADKHYIDLPNSTYVGDSGSDYEAAKNAGIRNFCWAKDYFADPST